MKITSAEFLKSALKEVDWPRDSIPEIAFSRKIKRRQIEFNYSLLGVRGLARTSSTPGRTQLLNFFLNQQQISGRGFARLRVR